MLLLLFRAIKFRHFGAAPEVALFQAGMRPRETPPAAFASQWDLSWYVRRPAWLRGELCGFTVIFFWCFKRPLTKMFLRVLEIIFFLYFATHIPITLFIDLQALLPEHVYPQQVGVTNGRIVFISHFYTLTVLPLLQLKDVLRWYSEEFKDPMVVDPPEWFKSFIFCEAFLQLPFFPIAAYAFLKGGWNSKI